MKIYKCKCHAKAYTVCPLCQCQYCVEYWTVCPRSSWHPTHEAVRAENIRVAEVLGQDTIANMAYPDPAIAPNAAYASARCAFGFANAALKG